MGRFDSALTIWFVSFALDSALFDEQGSLRVR